MGEGNPAEGLGLLVDEWQTREEVLASGGCQRGDRLETVLRTARSAFRFIRRHTDQGGLIDRNRYEGIISMLDRIARFEEFSLAEYTYELEGATPGIRLWLEGSDQDRRVSLILFPDVRQWRLDWQERRIRTLLLSLVLFSGGLRPEPGPGLEGYFPDRADWRECLFRALYLPLTI